MKFAILSVVCLVGAVVAAPSAPKRKRDILPGDPRYGTDYHHQHHQHHESHGSNEIQTAYGPPNYSPGQPIHYQESVQQPTNQYVPASAFSYKQSESVESFENAYLAPVAKAAEPQAVYHQPQEHHSASQSNAYLAPAASAPRQQPANQYLSPVAQATGVSRDSYGVPLVHHEAAAHQQEHVVAHAPAPVQHVSHHVQVQAAQSAPVQHVSHHVQVQAAQPAPVHHHAAPAQSHSHVQQSYARAPAPQAHQHVHAVHQVAQPAVHTVYQSEPQQYYSNGFESLGSSASYHARAAPQAQSHEYVHQQPAQTYHVQIVKAQPLHYDFPAQQVSQQEYLAPQAHQHVAQVSTYHENHVAPTQPSYDAHSESIRVESASSQESSQLIGKNGGYVY